MKARLIKPCQSVNTQYDYTEHRKSKAEGKPYPHDQYVTLPVGFEVEGPLVWSFCCPGHLNAAPFAEPIDDECRERVKLWMERERPNELENIRQMLKPENLKKLKKDVREHVMELGRAYRLDPDGPPIVAEPAAESVAEASEVTE